MFSWLRPTDAAIRAHLAGQAAAPFTYDFVGCTRDGPAPAAGFNIDRQRIKLGNGQATYERACASLAQWRMFPAAVAQLYGWEHPPRPDLVVGVLYRVWVAPVWVLFPARVVYLVDETCDAPGGPIRRHGFAYGTVADHPERGEERFQVEWHAADDSVYYDLVAISQPAHWLARAAYPYTRYEQARFRRLSAAAMLAASRAPPDRVVSKSLSSPPDSANCPIS